MESMGRGSVIMKVLEARKAMPAPGGEEEPREGAEEGFSGGMARGHCQKGLSMVREYLDGDEGQASPLRPKVEALAAAYEDLLSTLDEGGGEEEE
jgi:hypothetical protein